MLKVKSTLAAAMGLAAIGLVPTAASAGYVLDTGTPDGSTGNFNLGTKSWYAAEFTLSSPEQVTSLAAYVTQGSGQPGDTFSFDIDSGTFLAPTRSSQETVVESVTGTYTQDGWNSTSTNFTLAAGTYWLALEVGSTKDTSGLDLPGEPSTTNGTANAIAFAYAGTNGEFTTSGAPAVGVQIAASPVPMPASAWLIGSGLLAGMGVLGRRRHR